MVASSSSFFFFGVGDGVGHCGGCGFFFFCYDRCLKGLWVVGRGWVVHRGWVVAKVGCWSSKIASVWVQWGHGEISVGHDDGFGGDWRGSW